MICFDQKNLRDVFGETLVELGEMYDNLVVLDGDLNTSTRTVLFKDRFPTRFVQCGIAEQNMFSIAAGLALEGMIAIPVTFAAFASRKSLDQVYIGACLNKADVKIPGCYAGITAAECGASHNSGEDLAIMRNMPFIRVADPGDARELSAIMHLMMKTPGPVYFRVPRVQAVSLFEEGHAFEWGRGATVREGNDVTLAGTGMRTGVLVKAAELLLKKGIHVRVLHFGSVKPLDEELAIRAARETGLIITLENGRVAGGFGSAVAEAVCAACPARVIRMGIGDDVIGSDMIAPLMVHYHLQPRDVVDTVLAALVKP